MRRDDRDDPFDDLFREIERMMNDMMGGNVDMQVDTGTTGFGADTHVDIHEDEELVRVIADLPGVEKDDINLKCDGEAMTISAVSDHREYDERITLPARVDESSAKATYNNGVLEVTFEKTDESANISVE
ncbi:MULTISPECIES: Hsp20/alpha crystallin family protein [unclassified Haladaptatus]|uniref:Hsp20/alpha crystallin family protein n=1 Tax=unclassified Haladaptatus TaxID=2622732 RepID=UPI00209C0739|nr:MULTISPECIES: Hsp20/alpha crystallin family protein [unclassified Haladaptatus]MCO8244562.1 Hsp20/alpha crystallin family protein [Haladaptatus sp. AB643]MCO8253816.1 Hsp20/alpha crystallin family protein [Haladaptatus sp. AB618]